MLKSTFIVTFISLMLVGCSQYEYEDALRDQKLKGKILSAFKKRYEKTSNPQRYPPARQYPKYNRSDDNPYYGRNGKYKAYPTERYKERYPKHNPYELPPAPKYPRYNPDADNPYHPPPRKYPRYDPHADNPYHPPPRKYPRYEPHADNPYHPPPRKYPRYEPHADNPYHPPLPPKEKRLFDKPLFDRPLFER